MQGFYAQINIHKYVRRYEYFMQTLFIVSVTVAAYERTAARGGQSRKVKKLFHLHLKVQERFTRNYLVTDGKLVPLSARNCQERNTRRDACAVKTGSLINLGRGTESQIHGSKSVIRLGSFDLQIALTRHRDGNQNTCKPKLSQNQNIRKHNSLAELDPLGN